LGPVGEDAGVVLGEELAGGCHCCFVMVEGLMEDWGWHCFCFFRL
jgi:hypothetical protein